MNIIKKYRYDFSKEFLVYLDMFSKIHINDHRNVFNTAWLEWKEMNMSLINIEVERILSLGYEGDIISKIYHHARFSLSKKLVKMEKKKAEEKNIVLTKEKEKDIHKKFEKKEIMKKIVCHIEYFIKVGFICDHSPSDAFDDFYNNYLFDNEEGGDGFAAAAAIENIECLKKSYKNKYYVLLRKCSLSEKGSGSGSREEG